MSEPIQKQEVHVDLVRITDGKAFYRVRLDGSDAYYNFGIALEEGDDPFGGERFEKGVHSAMRFLNLYDPHWNQERINLIFAKAQ